MILGHPLMIMLLMVAAFMLLHFVVKYGLEDTRINRFAGLGTVAALVITCVWSCIQWAALLP